jgi:hypothetical protein
MKTSFKVAVAALAISAFVLDGCKKGENDPFLSLSSRKARVAGEWKVSAGSGTRYNSAFNMTETWTYDGATVTSTFTPGGTTTTSQTVDYTFEKDGTFKMVTITTSGGNTNTETVTGTWNFTGGVGEAKNKDHIVMRWLTYTDAYSNPASTSTDTWTGDDAPASIMYIDQLKGKEIIFKWEGTSQSGTSTADTESGTYTLTAK